MILRTLSSYPAVISIGKNECSTNYSYFEPKLVK